jgi:hypothetical protein
VQTLAVTAVPDPSAALRHVAEDLAARLGAPADGPAATTGAPDEPEELRRQLQVASAWAGPSRVAEVVAGDGRGEATFRLEGERCALLLALTLDPTTGAVTAVTLTPAP